MLKTPAIRFRNLISARKLIVSALVIGFGLWLYDLFKPNYSYARITAHLLYEGEPVTIDYVLTCRWIARGGNMAGYVRTEVDPYYYGVPTPSGGMVVMVAPSYCGTKPKVTNYLPLFMTGDKAGDFSFMTAYMAEEAYGNPMSKLSVLDVTMTPATSADKRALVQSGAPNVVPNPDNKPGEPGDTVPSCGAFEIIPVPPGRSNEVDLQRKTSAQSEQRAYWLPSSRLYAEIAKEFYKSHGSADASFTTEYMSQGYGAVRRAAEAQASKGGVKVGAADAASTPLLFDKQVFVIAPIDFGIWHDKALARSIPAPTKENALPAITVRGHVDPAAIGKAYCGTWPNVGFNYRITRDYLFPEGGEVATDNYDIMQNADVLWHKIIYFADPERSAK